MNRILTLLIWLASLIVVSSYLYCQQAFIYAKSSPQRSITFSTELCIEATSVARLIKLVILTSALQLSRVLSVYRGPSSSDLSSTSKPSGKLQLCFITPPKICLQFPKCLLKGLQRKVIYFSLFLCSLSGKSILLMKTASNPSSANRAALAEE